MNWIVIRDFIICYWKEILSVGAIIISVLINLIRRRPSYNLIDEIKEDILELLPRLISKVETVGEGAKKKEAVIQMIELYVKRKFKLNLNDSLVSFVSDQIESILATPQRKDVFNER